MSRLQQIESLRQELIGNGELASRVTAVREASVSRLPELVQLASQKLEQKLAKVYAAQNATEAAAILGNLLKNEQQVVRAYSNTLSEIRFDTIMAEQDIKVCPTRLEEIVRQEMELPVTGHPHLVTLDQSATVIEEGLRRYTRITGDADQKTTVQLAKEQVKAKILQCEFGVTGANAIVAPNGVIVLAEDEGNVRAVSNLPYKHVVVVGLDKIVPSAEDAMAIVKATAMYGTGRITSTYYSLIAGPSRTADIEFRMAYGMHGPKEVHVILLDNGRTAVIEQGGGCLMKCIDCGACYEACTALANRQEWQDIVLTPKQIALGIVQGKIAPPAAGSTMADFLCPVGLSASLVVNSLARLSHSHRRK